MDSLDEQQVKEIVKGCINGDRRCHQKFYEFFYSKMMGVCFRYSKNSEDAKDLLHDAFMKVFKYLESYSFEGSLEGWVRRIVVNTAIDRYRKNKKAVFISEEDIGELPFQFKDYQPGAVSQINEKDLMNAVQSLSPAYQAVFNLYAIEGYSHKEIAEQLGISEGTSKSNLAKARMNLQGIIDKLMSVKDGTIG